MILLLPAAASGSFLKADASVDTTSGHVGDLFDYTIRIAADSGLAVEIPEIKKSPGDFEVISSMEPSVRDSARYKIYNLDFKIAAYRVGELSIPAVDIKAVDRDGAESTAWTEEIPITIMSVLPEKSSDSLDIKDIKPIVGFPWPTYYYIVIASGLILAAFLIYWFFLRRKKAGLFTRPPKLPDPPWVVALRMLDELKHSRLMERGEYKQFYFKLSEIGKYYIDRRFGFPAIERTTAEIKEGFEYGRPQAIDDKFIEFLEYSDLVKFAKYPSSITRCTEWMEYIEDIIRRTKVVEPVTGEKAEAVK